MKCGTILGGILLFASVIMLAMSFDTVSPIECAVKISSLSPDYKKATLVTAGRHYIGLTNKLIKYPADLIFLKFDGLDVKTAGGQVMLLEMSFQIRLMISDLVQVAANFQENYKPKFLNVLQTTINSFVSTRKFTTDDYFGNRAKISAAIHIAVNEALKNYYAVVESMQLLNVKAPAEIDRKVLDKLLSAQTVKKTLQKSEALLVRAETSALEGKYIAEANVARSLAEADAKIIAESAKATAVQIKLDARAEAYKTIKQELGFSNDELLKWMLTSEIQQLPADSKLAVGVKQALMNFN